MAEPTGPAPVARVPLTTSELQEFANEFQIGDIVEQSLAADGIENHNYFLRTETDGRPRNFVLTIVRTPSYAPELLAPLLDACAADGLPVAPPIATSDGARHLDHDGTRVMVAARLPGQHVVNPTLGQCKAIGRFMARLHIAGASLRHAAPLHPRGVEWIESQGDFVAPYLPYVEQKLLSDASTLVISALDRKDVQSLPDGVIHGDLFRDNALFSARGITGVLDFHHASRGALLFDIAVAINDWASDIGGVIDPERAQGIVAAYHGVRPLEDTEIWFFPTFCIYAGLAFWLSRLVKARTHRDTPGARIRNPGEYHDIVAQHASHQFYLDRRLLD